MPRRLYHRGRRGFSASAVHGSQPQHVTTAAVAAALLGKAASGFVGIRQLRQISRESMQARNIASRRRRVSALLSNTGDMANTPYANPAMFKNEVERYSSDYALQVRRRGCREPPEVEAIGIGECQAGVFAGLGSVRVQVPALEVFRCFSDPSKNKLMFARSVAAVNHRFLVHEDKEAKTRLFEVSKTGRWRVLGIPFGFESTVLALEDWNNLQIDFGLKKPGAMQHLSGFWRAIPVSKNETLVLYYTEAVPSIPLPPIFRGLSERLVKSLQFALLEDVQKYFAGDA